MGLKKLGSKLKSKLSAGSGTFDLADDLKNLFRTTSRPTQPRKHKTPGHQARDRFYEEAELNSNIPESAASSGRAYYSKRPDYDLNGFSFTESNKGFGTSLHEAAASGDTKELQKLLLEGADIDAEDVEGCTALHHAVKAVQIDAVEVLLQSGADANAQDLEGNTPLHGCCSWIGCEPDVDIITLLLQAGADVCSQNVGGWTPLHEAAVTGQAEVIRQLVALGASVNSRSKEGDTALHKAARWGHLHVVQMLLALGSDVNAADNLGRRPIDRTNLEEVIALLQQYNSMPQSQRPAQQSPPKPQSIPERTPSRSASSAHMRRESILAELKETYETQWKKFNLSDSTDPLGFLDIPFPIRDPDLTSLTEVILYGAEDEDSKRKRLRAELLRWHPDKFLGKFSARLKEDDQEAIMNQVKDIARTLHTALKVYS